MDKREQGRQILIDRIKTDKDGANTLGLNRFKDSPTYSLNDPPILIMLEGEDPVIKASKRSDVIYPCMREVEIILELIVNETVSDVRSLLRVLRNIVFTGGVVLLEGVFIREIMAVGPIGYGVPEILGMKLILGMLYTDNGN